MELSSRMSLIHHPFPLLVFTAIQGSAFLLAGRWGRDWGQQKKIKKIKGTLQAHSLNSPLPLFLSFPHSLTSIPSSLHLLASRNYLSPCKGASSIPWFIACCQRNGSCFDWIEGARAFVSLLGHSCVCVRDDFRMKGLFFFNLLKAPCLSGLHLCLLLPLSPPASLCLPASLWSQRPRSSRME